MPEAGLGRRQVAIPMNLATRAQMIPTTLICLLLLACEPPPDLSPIERWLSCEECDRGERAAVVALGDHAVSVLDTALRGLSPLQRQNIDSQTIQGLRLGRPDSTPNIAIAERFRANFIATRQQRAALALGDIGTPDAIEVLRQALNEAEARGYRLDVIRVIEGALTAGMRLGFLGAMAVDVSGGRGRGGRGRGYGPLNRAGFGDTVLLFANKDDTTARWDGDETVTLHGSPFPDAVVVGRVGDSLMRFIAFANPGAYSVEIGALGSDDSKAQTAPLLVMPTRPRLRGFAPGPEGRRNLDPANFPDTILIPLSAYSADTSDHFQIEPAAALRVRANAESAQSFETASLRWLSCGGAPLSRGDVIHGIVVNQEGMPVSTATIRAPALGANATTTTDGYFALTLPASAISRTVDITVTAIQHRPVRHRVVPTPDTLRIGLVATATSQARAVARFSTTNSIPAGGCTLLQVGIPAGSGRRLVRLIVE